MTKCCMCREKAEVLDDDGLTPFCGLCWIKHCSPKSNNKSAEFIHELFDEDSVPQKQVQNDTSNQNKEKSDDK